ncbi:OmpA family protein [Varunaivibrio sulfuroxidans]|nr:OmpA family protein [Varunaivibrio sulfuroxidans]WES30450.1 OmpA family protein [Varunaivibrio sulfuroxidans]
MMRNPWRATPFLGGCLGLILVLAACAAPGDGARNAASPQARAIATQPFGAYGASIERLRRARAAHPEDIDLTVALARNLRYAGKADAAAKVLADAPARFAKNGRFLAELGAVRLARGDFSAGLAALKKAEAQTPGDWRVLSSLGVANDLMGAHGPAQAAFAEALKACPDNAAIMNNLAISQALSGRMDDAIVTLRRALALDRHRRQIDANLGVFLDIKGQCPSCGAARLSTLSATFFAPSPTALGEDETCPRSSGKTDAPSSEIKTAPFARLMQKSATPSVNIEVHFRFDSAVLQGGAQGVLDALGRTLLLPALKDVRFEIAGHTDAVGSASYNRVLSELRAEAVKKYLTDHFQITPARLVTRGFGEARLIDPRHPDGAVNRRVQVTRLPRAQDVSSVAAGR